MGNSMKKEIETALAEHEKRLDELFFQLGDVLDVKASVVLVAISFLGTISALVLAVPDLPYLIRGIQILAVLALAGGMFATMRCLWPRVFEAPPDTTEWLTYLEELEKHFEGKADSSELVAQDLFQAISKRRQERIAKNRALTSAKSKLNDWSIRATVVAASAEGLSLLWLAFWHLLE
jgi:hypothetical protein